MSQNYEYGYYGGEVGDYTDYGSEKKTHIMCYTCHYHRIDAETNQGEQRCDDPFQVSYFSWIPLLHFHSNINY